MDLCRITLVLQNDEKLELPHFITLFIRILLNFELHKEWFFLKKIHPLAWATSQFSFE
jgi:hypothetical protein